MTVDWTKMLDAVPSGNLIGGRWRPARDGREVAVEDPSTGKALRAVADSGPADALDALDAADAAAAGWARTPPRRRADVLRRAHELMHERRDALALLVTLEMGKPLAESAAEVDYAAGFLRWYSEEAVRINGRYAVPESGNGRILTTAQPIGPCLFITPWNFPLAMGTRKIGPGLAAGCTCVVKPAAQTPLSMLALAEILAEAGVPDGVVNVVTTARAGATVAPLLADPRLRKLSFTGSTEVGRKLVRAGADQLLRVSMELGGNAPFIVFDDADLDAAVDGAVVAKMRNGGEACTAANRFLVQDGVLEEFTGRLAQRLGALRMGAGADDGVELGPIIDGRQRARVTELVDDAVRRGARVLIGGRPEPGPGYFYPATVLDRIDSGAPLLGEEVFAPVAPVVAFADADDALTLANSSTYGLAAYLYTSSLDRAFTLAEALESGMVALNQGTVSNVGAPFGGVKHSGVGREGGPEGMAEYLETKYIALGAGLTPS